MIDLFLFTTNPTLAGEAIRAGVAGIVIDWEFRDKPERQSGFDTQINRDTPADLAAIRAALPGAHVLCRINGPGPALGPEIDAAIEAGASEILLPMVRDPREAEAALVRSGIPVGILIETAAAATRAADFATLPLARVYVGLNDLAIDRRSRSLFTALADGTVDRIREALPSVPFGVAGLTLPDRGDPIPCRLLTAELARLNCHFTFLRRSFLRDTARRDLTVEVPRIHEAFSQARDRESEKVSTDRQEFIGATRLAAHA